MLSNLNCENSPTIYFGNQVKLFRQFISAKDAAFFLDTAKSLSKRKVICKADNVSFSEQAIPPDHELHNFFSSKQILAISQELLNVQSTLKRMLCWTSIYQKHEFINPHKDVSGDLQLLLCLQNDGFKDQGLFCFQFENETHKIFLNPGDLLFFEATKIEHYTTPIFESETNPNPYRTVAVARQFFS